jgi:hypothetical protein
LQETIVRFYYSGFTNVDVDRGFVIKFNNSLNASSFDFKSYKFVTRKPKGSHPGSSKGPSS